jgi:hypothetical protein
MLTRDQVDKFIKKYNKRGTETVEALGKVQGFIKAVESEMGRAFLAPIIVEHERLLALIVSMDATEEDKADYRATRKFLLYCSSKVNYYYDTIESIKKTI